jgi:hypothetical protein
MKIKGEGLFDGLGGKNRRSIPGTSATCIRSLLLTLLEELESE